MNEYEGHKEQRDEIRKENVKMLKLFEEDMKGLSPATISRHLTNVDFYINTYLQYEEPCDFREGISMIDNFLGYFFIRKCMWSTPGNIKSTAASIKKFYQCMLKRGMIEEDDYKQLCKTIKENMPVWQDACAAYIDPDAEDPFDL